MNPHVARQKTALEEEPDPTQEVYLELVRTHELLSAANHRFFQQHGVTPQQYNVLRVLYVRDEGDGVPCSTISSLLLNRVPDITRLLDRLERGGLVTRHRCESDRRVVRTRLTPQGHDLVETLHSPLHAHHQELAGHLDADELDTLTKLLTKLRTAT